MSPKNIVVLGGSYAGLSTAHYLLRHAIPQLPDSASYQLTLVSLSAQVFCRPACPRALISNEMFDQKKLFVSIEKALEQYPKASIRFINGAATDLDHTKRIVFITTSQTSIEEIEFHALVIATGASTPSPLLSLNRDDEFLRTSWNTFRQTLSTAKSIVIAGGGPAGVETAGELGEYLNGRSKSNQTDPKVFITIVTAGAEVLPALRPTIARKAENFLAQVGVKVIKNTRVQTITPENAGRERVASKATLTLDNGSTLDADLFIPATGTTPNTGFVSKELLLADGRINTNPSTLRVDKAGPRIYAVGDVGSHARPAVHQVLNAIPIVCANIKRDLLLAAGKDKGSVGEDRIFKEDTRETQMVPIGKNKGVGAAMGHQLPSLMVWMIKGRDYWLWTTGQLWSGKQWAKES